MTNPAYSRWVTGFVDRNDLDGYARERVEEELESDPTLTALWGAMGEADDRESALRTFDDDEPTDVIDTLGTARRSCDDALEQLAFQVMKKTLKTEVHGYNVDLMHKRELDCPGCGEDGVEAYYLGTASVKIAGSDRDAAGWVCGHCGETLVEDLEETIILRDSPEEGAV